MILKDYEQVESTNIDYKEKLEVERPKSWLKTVSAFANTKGGILLYGVDDERNPIGLDDIKFTSAKISELINSKITPVPRYELNPFEENGRDFLEVNIK